jgi:hypothetical protein
MVTYDLFQVVVGIASLGCVTPILILLVLLRAAILIERYLLRRSLWLWLIPITVWLARNERLHKEQAHCPHKRSH